LGFDVPETHARQVVYANFRWPWPETVDESFVQQLLFTKFSHWSYEDEYRVYAQLETAEDGLYFADFSEHLLLREVIVGCESRVSRSEIQDALGSDASSVTTFKVRAAFTSFRIVRNQNEKLWA